MKEQHFNTEVVNSFKSLGCFAYKIADSPTSWTMRKTRFTPDKPCDIVVCAVGAFLAVEGKLLKKWQGLNEKTLRPSQIKALDEVVKSKGKAYVLVNIRIPPNPSKKVQRENWCVILDWKEHRQALLKGTYTAEVLKSPYAPGIWVTSKLVEKKRLWNLDPIINP